MTTCAAAYLGIFFIRHLSLLFKLGYLRSCTSLNLVIFWLTKKHYCLFLLLGSANQLEDAWDNFRWGHSTALFDIRFFHSTKNQIILSPEATSFHLTQQLLKSSHFCITLRSKLNRVTAGLQTRLKCVEYTLVCSLGNLLCFLLHIIFNVLNSKAVPFMRFPKCLSELGPWIMLAFSGI